MKRPLAITIWAAFLTFATVAGLASSAWLHLSGIGRSQGLYEGVYAYYTPVSHVVGVIVLIGLWTMRKWAFVGYIAAQLLGAAVFWATNPVWTAEAPWTGWGALIIATLFAVTTLPYWPRMSWRPLPFKDAQ